MSHNLSLFTTKSKNNNLYDDKFQITMMPCMKKLQNLKNYEANYANTIKKQKSLSVNNINFINESPIAQNV